MDWKKTVAKVAPGIANMIGGPLAGMATQALCGALGLPKGTSKDQVAAAVQNMTPDQAIALKKADNDFAVRMKELDIDVYKIDADDRKSARGREVKVGSAMVNGLAVLIMVAFIAAVGYILFNVFNGTGGDINPNLLLLAGSLIGYLSAKAEQVVSYFFGSSAGSAKKTEQLAAQFNKLKT